MTAGWLGAPQLPMMGLRTPNSTPTTAEQPRHPPGGKQSLCVELSEPRRQKTGPQNECRDDSVKTAAITLAVLRRNWTAPKAGRAVGVTGREAKLAGSTTGQKAWQAGPFTAQQRRWQRLSLQRKPSFFLLFFFFFPQGKDASPQTTAPFP